MFYLRMRSRLHKIRPNPGRCPAAPLPPADDELMHIKGTKHEFMKGLHSTIARSVLSALLVAGYSAAEADTKTDVLGKAPGATDIYQVDCYNDDAGAGAPVRLDFEVEDLTPAYPPLISVDVVSGALQASTTDTRDGDRKPSPAANVYGGAGPYMVSVYKTAKPTVQPSKLAKAKSYKETYRLTYHCRGPSGHAGTIRTTRQNQ